jgi:hypothetical protein
MKFVFSLRLSTFAVKLGFSPPRYLTAAVFQTTVQGKCGRGTPGSENYTRGYS